MIALASNHLRRRIARTAACSLKSLPRGVGVRKPKVHNFNVAQIVEQQVLWLEIPVANARLVNVLNARNNLLEKLACFLFF